MSVQLNVVYPTSTPTVDAGGLDFVLEGAASFNDLMSPPSVIGTALVQRESVPTASNFTVLPYNGGLLPSCDIAGHRSEWLSRSGDHLCQVVAPSR